MEQGQAEGQHALLKMLARARRSRLVGDMQNAARTRHSKRAPKQTRQLSRTRRIEVGLDGFEVVNDSSFAGQSDVRLKTVRAVTETR